MTDSPKESFAWKELVNIFCIREDECEERTREKILQNINGLTDRFGREYVIKKIALRQQ